jgi:Arc/MetJ-type ribon-helix-helix transcriptional regulator
MSGTKKTDGYRTIRIQDSLYEEIENMTKDPESFYRSVSEFAHEALRVRLEEVRHNGKKPQR